MWWNRLRTLLGLYLEILFAMNHGGTVVGLRVFLCELGRVVGYR